MREGLFEVTNPHNVFLHLSTYLFGFTAHNFTALGYQFQAVADTCYQQKQLTYLATSENTVEH